MKTKIPGQNAGFVISTILLVMACTAGGQTIFVDAGAAGADNGTSWADAYNCLQDALAAASSGDEIWVAQGTYRPDKEAAVIAGDRAATFQLANGVTLRGGYAGSSAPDPNARDIDKYRAILSGDLNGNDGPEFADSNDNSYHVVTGSGTDATAVLDGFVITGGNADGIFSGEHYTGGGMHNSKGSPSVKNCMFSRNSASRGGGIGNLASHPTVTNCTFGDNWADYGSGMYNGDRSSPAVTNCTFTDNSALYGGGICNRNTSSPALTNCIFGGNSAECGGAMWNYIGCAPTLINCTLSRNTARSGGGIWSFYGRPTTANCILWDNEPEDVFYWYNPPVIVYSNVRGGWPGEGNIAADPLFVNADHGDYRLLPGSACIDAGQNAALPGDTADLDGDGDPNELIPYDIEGNPRILGDIVDIGAYEGATPIPNIIPVADAGQDQAVLAGLAEMAEVPLNGSGSYDPDGDELTYLWKWTIDDANFAAEGVGPAVQLPTGQHTIELIVNDGMDNSLPDQVVVTVTGPIQTELAVDPDPIRRYHGGSVILIQLRLPDGINRDQIVAGEQLLLYPGGIAGRNPPHFMQRDLGIPEDRRISLLFKKAELLQAVGNVEDVELKVVGQLASGQYFYGSKIVQIRP
jgi:hypothetical protein